MAGNRFKTGKKGKRQEQSRSSQEARQQEARKKRKEQNIRQVKEAAASRVSYVKKPLARRSFFAAGFLAASLVLGGLGIYGGFATRGQAPLTSAAMGLCSMILGAVSVWYGLISFLEEEKNYLLAKICTGIGVLWLAAWIITIVMGVRG